MAKRKKSSGVEDAMDMVAMLPWWAGLALASVSYLVLHALAQPVAVPAGQALAAGNLIFGTWIRGVAWVGQFVLPAICLFGALGSFLQRRQRQVLVDDVARSPAADALQAMSWPEFELLVGQAFRLQGYNVAELGGAGADGGVDLVLSKGAEKFLVQCKQWKAFKVGVTVVRELYGVMAARGSAGGFVVTSGRFTADAAEFARGRNIDLIDGPLLHGWIKEAQQAGSGGAVHRKGNPSSFKPDCQPAMRPAPSRSLAPSCPSCGSGMTRRTARRGAHAGSEFWGCGTYPVCKGTASL